MPLKIKESFAMRTISATRRNLSVRDETRDGTSTASRTYHCAGSYFFLQPNSQSRRASDTVRNMSASVRVVPPERGDSDVRSESLQGDRNAEATHGHHRDYRLDDRRRSRRGHPAFAGSVVATRCGSTGSAG